MHVIYCILNLENGRHYIGSAVNFNARKSMHIHHLRNGTHHSVKLQNSWNKRGENAFRFDAIELVGDKKLLIEREQFWINETRPFYNICRIAGSRLGCKATAEQVKAMSETGKRFWGSEAGAIAKKKMSETKMGTVTSDVTKEKLRQIFLGVKLKPEHSAKISASLKGISRGPLTDMQKKNLSEKLSGRKLTEEHIAKLKIANTGFKHTDDSIALMKEVKRKVTYEITSPNSEVYYSNDVKGFSNDHKLDHQSMYRVARGVQKHHRGWLINKFKIEGEVAHEL